MSEPRKSDAKGEPKQSDAERLRRFVLEDTTGITIDGMRLEEYNAKHAGDAKGKSPAGK